MRMNGGRERITVGARRALLDVLGLLGPHRDSVILVGAQAIYLHTGDAGLPASPFTKDADLALDPRALGSEPQIVDVLAAHGYTARRDWPGVWRKSGENDQVDFLVPATLAGKGTRSAKLKTQGDRLALRAAGLEGVLVDNAPMRITALEDTDTRRFTIAVAGPSSLLVAKLWKLGERHERKPQRMSNKDALDVLRLLRQIDVTVLAEGFQRQLKDPVSAPAVQRAAAYLQALFQMETAQGAVMAAEALDGLEDPTTIRVSCAALASDLLAILGFEGS